MLDLTPSPLDFRLAFRLCDQFSNRGRCLRERTQRLQLGVRQVIHVHSQSHEAHAGQERGQLRNSDWIGFFN